MANEIDSTRLFPGKLTTSATAPLADKKNLVPGDFTPLFTANHSIELQKLHANIVEAVSKTEAWYRRSKDKKKWGASITRGAAVILTALATMTPIVHELLPSNLNSGWKPVPVVALLAAMAGTSVALDKLMGLSSGWMRYISAMMEIQTKLDVFRFAWNQAALEEQLEPKTPKETLTRSLALLSGLLMDVREVLRNETQAWATEFKTSMTDLEKAVETQRAATEAQRVAAAARPSKGMLRIKVTNADQLDGKSYRVRINGGPSQDGTGPVIVLPNLEADQVKIQVSGKKGGADVSAEEGALIKPGEINTVELQLG